jgi:hypothetical protein
MALGSVMGITLGKQIGKHLLRFGFSLFGLTILPLYSASRLPFSDAATLLTLLSAAAFCVGGTSIFVWEFIRTAAIWFTDRQRRSRLVLLGVFQVAGLLVFSLIVKSSHHALQVALFLIVFIVIGGGVWALGATLQWLWEVADPNAINPRSAGIARSLSRTYPFPRKAASRG